MLELRRAIALVGVLVLTGATLIACPERGPRDSQGKPPVQGCTKAYEQCELGNGLLGVCDVVDCAPGAPEPCLRCRSQH